MTPCRERVSRVLLMLAGGQREVRSMPEGSIAVVVGLKNVSFGLFVSTSVDFCS